MAVVALRNDTEGRACYRRRLAAGKTTMEAMRCLKRRLSGIAYRQMTHDARRARATGPGGHTGTTTGSSVAGSDPCTGSSEKSLPGPAANNPTPAPVSKPIRSSASSRRPSIKPRPQPLPSEVCLTTARTGPYPHPRPDPAHRPCRTRRTTPSVAAQSRQHLPGRDRRPDPASWDSRLTGHGGTPAPNPGQDQQI